MIKPSRVSNWGMNFLVIVIVCVAMAPFYIMLTTSLKTPEATVAYPPQFIPQPITWMHFSDVLNPSIFPFLRYFLNSLIIAGSTSVIAIIVASLAAYSFAKLPIIGKNFLLNSIFVVYMFSGILLVVPLFKIISSVGLHGSRIAVIVSCLVSTLPAAITMLTSYFKTIPDSLEEAAMIDGLSRVGCLVKIILPLSVPAIISVMIYIFMIAWNDFLFASIFLSDPDKMTLPVGLRQFFSSKDYVWGRMMAASLLTAMPVIVMFMGGEKFITGGLTAGGVKG